MKPWYAGNARNLLQARQMGSIPYGPVVVEMTGGAWDVTTLYVDEGMSIDRLDWRMLVNLDVWIWTNPKVALERVTETALRIAKARPKTLFVRFETGEHVHDVELGDGFHLVPPDPFPPIHQFRVCISNNTGSKVGAAMRRALMSKFNGIELL